MSYQFPKMCAKYFCHSLTYFSPLILMCYRIKQYSMKTNYYISSQKCVPGHNLGVNCQPFYPKSETPHTCSGIDMNVKCSRILYNSVTHENSWRIVRLTVLTTQVYHLFMYFRLRIL